MKRDRLGRFLSPGASAQRGSSGGGGGGGGRARGRPARGGPDVAEAAALVAARLGWGPARACADAGADGADEAGTARALAMGHCRLCHGKFSSRSLRSISGRAPGESSEGPPPGDRVFVQDFQSLLGVAVHEDPALSQFVCKNCHSQFYQCRGLLTSFLQRVNVPPMGRRKPCAKVGVQPRTGAEEGACVVDLIASSPQGLRGLVGWVHGHAAGCGALPSLQRTLSSEYCGIIRAVWSCGQGHDYTMDADSSCGALLLDSALGVTWAWDKESAPRLPQHRGSSPTEAAPQSSQGRATAAGAETETLPSTDTARPPSEGDPVGPGLGAPPQPSTPHSGAPGQLGEKQVPSPTSDDRVKDEFSDLSEGDFLSEDENDKKQNAPSSDESFEPYPGKNTPDTPLADAQRGSLTWNPVPGAPHHRPGKGTTTQGQAGPPLLLKVPMDPSPSSFKDSPRKPVGSLQKPVSPGHGSALTGSPATQQRWRLWGPGCGLRQRKEEKWLVWSVRSFLSIYCLKRRTAFFFFNYLLIHWLH
ncbi:zinc finger protein 276 isoform X5 [Hippopotamus amphibius kiboko]|uniref:zinc finger protein 276 isoform X5 n=1 Tax=Hippopotamus amphibius kiboko TaxID=575201 RepID=UPI0025973C7C|nr:zinc finger protein 276 isoform X5 [Hippopotamus amphibius kiboko]